MLGAWRGNLGKGDYLQITVKDSGRRSKLSHERNLQRQWIKPIRSESEREERVLIGPGTGQTRHSSSTSVLTGLCMDSLSLADGMSKIGSSLKSTCVNKTTGTTLRWTRCHWNNLNQFFCTSSVIAVRFLSKQMHNRVCFNLVNNMWNISIIEQIFHKCGWTVFFTGKIIHDWLFYSSELHPSYSLCLKTLEKACDWRLQAARKTSGSEE